MRTFSCQCGNTLFFDNSRCLACGSEVGYCPSCRSIAALQFDDAGHYRCGNASCGTALVKCANYSQHEVCNRCVAVDEDTQLQDNSQAQVNLQFQQGSQWQEIATAPLCDCCRFNQTIPDLSVPGHLQKWYRLEAAKRRLFYDLKHLGLPYGTAADGIEPSLAFDFKADTIPKGTRWRRLAEKEQVFTGHANGLITINIREADEVEREKARVNLGENKRTLIGHFRHEIGHFYWDVLVKGRREEAFKQVFGDHEQPTYADALEAYYQNGPAADWQERCITPYATMHPWEDFAETWSAYLAMVSQLDTAWHVGFGGINDPVHADATKMITRFQQLGVALNEMNRSMGLLDIVPEILVPPVIEKMKFIHDLVHEGRAENSVLQGEEESTAETTSKPQPVGQAVA